MKTKILLIILLIGIAFGCRSKNKITTEYKENKKETETVKVDSMSVQNSKSTQSESKDIVLEEKKNEISGDMLIKGKSDVYNPFVFHNVIGNDTIQSISIMGNAEYLISNHFTKADNKKSEAAKAIFTNNVQDSVQNSVSKETIKESKTDVSQETKKIKVNGFELAAWIFITIIGITLILIFFTYKYFKK